MTAFERAKRIYGVLHGRMATTELADRDIAIIKAEIADAIMDERKACEKQAENFYYSFTEILHQELTTTEKAVGMNIARCIRGRPSP